MKKLTKNVIVSARLKKHAGFKNTRRVIAPRKM